MFLECNISYSCCTFLTFAFRYPYYLLNVIDREVAFITWLRYTAWIPLYPTGFVLEGKNLMENRRFLCVKSHTSICCCRTCFSDVHGIVLVLYECWKIFITDVLQMSLFYWLLSAIFPSLQINLWLKLIIAVFIIYCLAVVVKFGSVIMVSKKVNSWITE